LRLRVLGCHGGELPNCKSTCFLIDEVLALDAGALTGSLNLDQLTRVDDIVISHSHFDHVKDLPLLADLMMGRRNRPIRVHASRQCAKTLQRNMFNDSLWPDFTRIPNRRRPVLVLRTFRAGSTFRVGKYRIHSIPVSHPVESCGFVISNGTTAIAMSGDTGPTEKLWNVLNQRTDLKALLLETSFPNKLQGLADLSGHLTPQTLRRELEKFQRNSAFILLYHLKPAFLKLIQKELKNLPVEVLRIGDAFDF
jgi:cAMP phosphodiesterase